MAKSDPPNSQSDASRAPARIASIASNLNRWNGRPAKAREAMLVRLKLEYGMR